jgi:hypothetical protein
MFSVGKRPNGIVKITSCQVIRGKRWDGMLVELRESRHDLNVDGVVLDKSNRERPQGRNNRSVGQV